MSGLSKASERSEGAELVGLRSNIVGVRGEYATVDRLVPSGLLCIAFPSLVDIKCGDHE